MPSGANTLGTIKYIFKNRIVLEHNVIGNENMVNC